MSTMKYVEATIVNQGGNHCLYKDQSGFSLVINNNIKKELKYSIVKDMLVIVES